MEDTDGSASAIDPNRILPSIIHHCLPEGQAADLVLDHQFMPTRFRAHQIVRLIEFMFIKFHIDLATRALARAFDISHSAVTRAKLRGYDDPPGRGRHHKLAIESEQALVDWLTNKAANHMAINKTELLHECNERFGRNITRGWVDSFLKRHADQLFETTSVPQENPRLDVPRAFLEASIDGFRDHIHNACAELVFDLDEMESANGKIAMRGGGSFHRR
jgi:transposase